MPMLLTIKVNLFSFTIPILHYSPCLYHKISTFLLQCNSKLFCRGMAIHTFLTVLIIIVQSLSISRMKDCEEMLACVVIFRNTIQVMCTRRGCMGELPLYPNILQATSDKESIWTFLFLFWSVFMFTIIYNIIQDIYSLPFLHLI